MPKHVADSANVEAIEAAIYFTVTMLVRGHHETIEVKTCELARRARPLFETVNGGARRALIYAVTVDGLTHLVPDSYQPNGATTMTTTQTTSKPNGKLPIPPRAPRGADLNAPAASAREQVAQGRSNVEAPKIEVLPAGKIIDGVDCGGMTDDPKKVGIPVYLQAQNKRELSPENKAKIDALAKKIAADKRAATIERKAMAKKLGAGVALGKMNKAGATLKSEKKGKSAKPAKSAKPRKKMSDDTLAELVKGFKRVNGLTNADVVRIAGKRLHVNVMRAICEEHKLKFKIDATGDLKHYKGIAS